MKKVFSLLMIFAALSVSSAQAQEKLIENGSVVKFDYTLSSNGETIEQSQPENPLEYTHGSGQIIPGLEEQLVGMKVGDTKEVTVTPDKAYGEYVEEAIQVFPKSSYPEGFQPQQGALIELQGQNGQVIPGIITAIDDESMTVNFNHPLAGKTLVFNVKIVDVQ